MDKHGGTAVAVFHAHWRERRFEIVPAMTAIQAFVRSHGNGGYICAKPFKVK